MVRRWRRGQKVEEYVPRGHLLARLQRELGMGETEVIEQAAREREFLLSLEWV